MTKRLARIIAKLGVKGPTTPAAPNGPGGMTTASSLTPAAWAGQTVISKVDGYAAAPPGTQTPTRRSGR